MENYFHVLLNDAVFSTHIYVCIYGIISVKVTKSNMLKFVIIYTLFLSCFTKEIEEVGQLFFNLTYCTHSKSVNQCSLINSGKTSLHNRA